MVEYKTMFNKKLKKRIKSLEDRLGLVYDGDCEYPDHQATQYNLENDVREVKQRVDKLEGKKKQRLIPE